VSARTANHPVPPPWPNACRQDDQSAPFFLDIRQCNKFADLSPDREKVVMASPILHDWRTTAVSGQEKIKFSKVAQNEPNPLISVRPNLPNYLYSRDIMSRRSNSSDVPLVADQHELACLVGGDQ
jgi:hypothetical protein